MSDTICDPACNFNTALIRWDLTVWFLKRITVGLDEVDYWYVHKLWSSHRCPVATVVHLPHIQFMLRLFCGGGVLSMQWYVVARQHKFEHGVPYVHQLWHIFVQIFHPTYLDIWPLTIKWFYWSHFLWTTCVQNTNCLVNFRLSKALRSWVKGSHRTDGRTDLLLLFREKGA